MAYSDYGAYIWKNGENITKECADVAFYFINNKWIEYDDYYEIYGDNSDKLKKLPTSEGHAVINFDNFCIEFYKTYEPVITFNNGARKQLEVLEKANFLDKNLNLTMIGYSIGHNKLINMFCIKFNNDNYCVIIGSGIGNGYDNSKISKYIKKNILFNNNFYHINTRDVDLDIVIDKLERLQDIKYEKYSLWNYSIKPFLKDLFTFKFNNISFHWEEIQERRRTIKWLR